MPNCVIDVVFIDVRYFVIGLNDERVLCDCNLSVFVSCGFAVD